MKFKGVKTHRSKPAYRPTPKHRHPAASHDGYRLRRHKSGKGWVFIEGSKIKTAKWMFTRADEYAINACAARRRLVRSSRMLMHPNYHP